MFHFLHLSLPLSLLLFFLCVCVISAFFNFHLSFTGLTFTFLFFFSFISAFFSTFSPYFLCFLFLLYLSLPLCLLSSLFQLSFLSPPHFLSLFPLQSHLPSIYSFLPSSVLTHKVKCKSKKRNVGGPSSASAPPASPLVLPRATNPNTTSKGRKQRQEEQEDA